MKGFTLIEVVLYIGLFSLLIGGAVTSAYALMQGGAHTQQLISIDEEGAFLNAKIQWEVDQAHSISAVSGGAVVLEPGDVVIAEVGGRMTIARGAFGAALPISSAALTVSAMESSVTPASGTMPAYVRIAYAINGVSFVYAGYLNE